MLKELKPYLQLFKSWEKQEHKDVGFVMVKFHKDNYTVVFEEDLREHIINFTILHPLKKIIKIYINGIKIFYIIARIFSVSDSLYNRKFFYISIWTKFPFFFPEDFFPIIVFLHFRIQFVL